MQCMQYTSCQALNNMKCRSQKNYEYKIQLTPVQLHNIHNFVPKAKLKNT